jgi:hypothetical protein
MERIVALKLKGKEKLDRVKKECSRTLINRGSKKHYFTSDAF